MTIENPPCLTTLDGLVKMMGLVRAKKVTTDEAQALALLSIAASLMWMTEGGADLICREIGEKLDTIARKMEVITAEIGRA